ncbi:hypothetical protein NEUTE2DRAFT_133921 [Neurospora tetrasperma FGSC 2509]|nr:hypothetical protein NEUTE2DRAFT_133921 [Neurospora tetrasperma FGSC 2509]
MQLTNRWAHRAARQTVPLCKPGFMLKIALPDDGEESASGQMGYRGGDNRASPALFASRKVRRHMCVLRVIGDPVIGHGPSSIKKKVGSCVARPKKEGRNSHDATTSASTVWTEVEGTVQYCLVMFPSVKFSCRITSCATIQIQLSKSPRAHPQQLVWPPTANIPRDIQGVDAKIDSQLNCGGKNEGLTVRCDCPPSML